MDRGRACASGSEASSRFGRPRARATVNRTEPVWKLRGAGGACGAGSAQPPPRREAAAGGGWRGAGGAETHRSEVPGSQLADRTTDARRRRVGVGLGAQLGLGLGATAPARVWLAFRETARRETSTIGGGSLDLLAPQPVIGRCLGRRGGEKRHRLRAPAAQRRHAAVGPARAASSRHPAPSPGHARGGSAIAYRFSGKRAGVSSKIGGSRAGRKALLAAEPAPDASTGASTSA